MMKIYKSIFKIIFLGVFALISLAANAQVQDISANDLSKIKVDLLTDEQISSLVERAGASGMSTEQMEALAKERGMPDSEIVKLSERVEKLKLTSTPIVSETKTTDRTRTDTEIKNETKTIDNSNIFGFSMFTNKNLSFEPSLNIATPQNYQLGPEDNLIIDVWGASEQTYTQKISPEGNIIISNLGPIYLNGLTIEEATIKIKKELSNIYFGIAAGNTFVKVSLGALRSIKVNIVGDVALPGTYNLSSLASVFNALYSAGGPAENGSLRNVKIIRGNKTVAELDIYEFLLKGFQKDNVRLQDQDVVFVSPYASRVEIKGEVKRPGLFDMKPSETLKDLIYFAGDFNGNAYSEWIKIYRKTGKEYKVIDVSSFQRDTFKLHNGDAIIVDTILNRFENRVEIKGAVFRPGIFAIDSVMTLKQLIKKAEGLRGDVFKNRITVYRTKEDLTLEVIALDLNKLYSNNEDVDLQREDIVYIPSIFDINEDYSVSINGEVSVPGKYPYVLNTTVEDLILQAGGLLESASFSRLEIARRIKDNMADNINDKIAEIYQFQISKDLKLSDTASKFILQPFDIVFVRSSPGYSTQALVKVEGEVVFPGSYSINSRTERISDLVKRSGNLTPEAYALGATLVRNFISESTININLEKILKKPGSNDDLFLLEGDVLKIPKKLQTVSLSGALQYPVTVRYEKRFHFKKYISSAGGFADNAKRSKSYLINSNGAVKRAHKILFFNKYPRVKPGSKIIVPEKPENKDKMSTAEAISLGSALASLSLMVVYIINALK